MILELHRAVSSVSKLNKKPEATDRVITLAEKAKIELEKATLIYRGAPIAAFGSMLNSIIVLFVGWQMVNRTVLLVWAGAIFLLALIRLGFWYAVRRHRPTPTVMHKFTQRNMIIMGLNGAMWGMLAPIFAVYGQIGHVFLPFILAGMTAAAIVSSGASWKCVLAFNIPALLPMAAAFFFWGGEGAGIIASVIILYGFLTSFVALQTSRMISRAIVLRSKNDFLAEALDAKFEDASVAEKRFKALIESSRDLTLIFSPDGVITYASPASEHILGISPETLVNTTTRDLVHQDDLPQLQAAGSKILSVLGEVREVAHICLKNSDSLFVGLSGRLTNMLYVPGVEGFVFTGSLLEPEVASRLHAAE